jgi:hypothetical protein
VEEHHSDDSRVLSPRIATGEELSPPGWLGVNNYW